MMFLQVFTQYMENYSDDVDQTYYKFKGGSVYVFCVDPRTTDIAELLNRFRGCVESTGYSPTYVREVRLVDAPNQDLDHWITPVDTYEKGDHFYFRKPIYKWVPATDGYVTVAHQEWSQVAGSEERLGFTETLTGEAA